MLLTEQSRSCDCHLIANHFTNWCLFHMLIYIKKEIIIKKHPRDEHQIWPLRKEFTTCDDMSIICVYLSAQVV